MKKKTSLSESEASKMALAVHDTSGLIPLQHPHQTYQRMDTNCSISVTPILHLSWVRPNTEFYFAL